MPIASKLRRIFEKTKIEVTLDKRAKDPDTEEIYAVIKCVGEKPAKNIAITSAEVKSKSVVEVPPEIALGQADTETVEKFLKGVIDNIDKHYKYMKTVVDTQALKKILKKKTLSPPTTQHLKALARWLAQITCPELTTTQHTTEEVKELKPGEETLLKVADVKKAVIPRVILHTRNGNRFYILPPGTHKIEITAKGTNTTETKAKVEITL